MLYTASINETRNMFGSSFSEAWVIVRSLKNPVQVRIGGVEIPTFHVPALSPSWALFKDYLNWQKAGEWDKARFENGYAPRFLAEMHSNEAKSMLNMLFQKSLEQDILCLCFCGDESLCHRSIIQGLVHGAREACGISVPQETGDTMYYDRWRQAQPAR